MTEETRRKKQRIRVAKDVLKSLNTMKVKRGAFVAGNRMTVGENDSQKVVAKKLQKQCQVCALGACLLSTVKLYNKLDLLQANGGASSLYGYEIENRDMFNRLLDSFSPEQIILIEQAFEQGGGYFSQPYYESNKGDLGFDGYLPAKLREAAVKFGNNYANHTRRLGAIMRSIIANDGEFIPSKRVKREIERAEARSREEDAGGGAA